MSVIRTDRWLTDLYDDPVKICKKLKVHFDGASASEIYDYLAFHGMYTPQKNGNIAVKKLRDNKVWDIVQNEKQKLQKIWEGPSIPVFIFPSDTTNEVLKREFHGKSGLAFKDKLFLFVSEENNDAEIRSLFTHEYNHACRLSKYHKDEADYVLLDTIILEGMAENAVRERLGTEFMSNWTSYYPNKKLEKIWRRLVYPNRNVLKTSPKHQNILYGLRSYPKMAGYCVGYYLVKKYMESTGLSSKDLLSIHSEEFASIANKN
ncbi:DUF2268 domain-containing protein [Siminovitchia fortis]|uniref:DUF2268 domain-containing protein n=1 Tax=Siminovitchia fortis TaxID=254758 RepID=UPI0011A9F13C|nr:DUF2268 domain-containing protein [Siminovitchia fortis]